MLWFFEMYLAFLLGNLTVLSPIRKDNNVVSLATERNRRKKKVKAV